MENSSSSVLVKRLEAEVRQVLRQIDVAERSGKERKIVADLQQSLIDARIYANAYESDETAKERLADAKAAKKWLDSTRRLILAASEYDIFTAIDVAQLTAQIELIMESLA